MARVFTSEELITEVRRIGVFNDVNSEGKTDTDILNALNTVMFDELVPSLVKYQEDNLIKSFDFPFTSADTFIPIPERAVGNTLRDLYYVSTDTQSQYLPMINREDIPFYNTVNNFFTNRPDGFYLEGDAIRLIPMATAGTLRISYFFRPGALVLAANYRKVASITNSTTIEVDSTVPTAWTTATVFDAHSGKSGGENRYFDLAASTVSGTTITFTTAIDGSLQDTRALAVGDYVVEEENAAIPGLPRDMHPILAQAAATRLLESDGDTEALELARGTLARQLQNMNHILEARVVGKPKKITNRNSFVTRQISRGGW